MSTEQELAQFTQLLREAGMPQPAIVSRTYDFALALLRAEEEKRTPLASEIAAETQADMMRRAVAMILANGSTGEHKDE
jgi:hypothetical protein